MATPPIAPAPHSTLSELVAAQQAHTIPAHALGDDLAALTSLRRAYARKRADLAAVLELTDEAAPDLLLRTVDGRQVPLRLHNSDAQQVMGLLCGILREELGTMEADIVDHLHCMQQTAQPTASPERQYRAAILALCAPNDPALPTPSSVWLARVEAAEELEEQLQQQHGNECAYGREILWHPLFPAEYVACVSKLPLYEVVEFHEALDSSYNQRRPLDGHDLQYLLDVLSEALASQPTELASLRLRRALAWVEQARANPATGLPTAPAAAVPTSELAPAA